MSWNERDISYMREALSLAARARGRTSPNPMVGCVIVRDGHIVGRGYHPRAGEPHAEVHALKEATSLAKGATAYVTLEPCSHHGRTPPCADALINAGVARVVIAMEDPNPRVNGNGVKALRKHGIQVDVGLLQSEAEKLNEGFLTRVRTGRPFTIYKSAITLDGKVATQTGHSRWVTGPEARQYVHQMRDEVDAIMVGIGTALADDPLLTTRLDKDDVKHPLRVVVDSQARFPASSRMLQQEVPGSTVVATLASADKGRKQALVDQGAEVLSLPPGDDGRVDLNELFRSLADFGVNTVLLEGGPTLATAALKAGVINRCLFFIAPKIVGGTNSPVLDLGIADMSDAIQLRDIEHFRVGDDIAIAGDVKPEERG